MLRVQTEHEQMAAMLHDVVEDCGLTLDELRAAGYPSEVVAAIDALTRRRTKPTSSSWTAPSPIRSRVA